MSWASWPFRQLAGWYGRRGTDRRTHRGSFRGSDGRVRLARHVGAGDPPPGKWKECHPSTVNRFKAEVTCPNGHGLTLKGHSVSAGGVVRPSVVCPSRGCAFHEFVELSGWTHGETAR